MIGYLETVRAIVQAGEKDGARRWLEFIRPEHILATNHLGEVVGLLDKVDRAAKDGLHAVGFVSYEAAPAFDAALHVHPPGPLPLVWFGLFREAREVVPPVYASAKAPFDGDIMLDEAAYAAAVAAIKREIAAGATYQVNFTLRLRGPAPTDALAAFWQLDSAQLAAGAGFIETPEFAVCSASPELFFRLEENRIVCQPMKGTAPRGRWVEEDDHLGAQLQASEKNRAENVMVVDMVRNDLGHIAEPGSIETSSLFDVQRLPTLWQMTSMVVARTSASLPDIFAALFPSASVTGAPKVQTMGIIRSLETEPRGVYTGAIGYAGPGRRARFNVAIRTLEIDKKAGRADYGIGSGIVWDSEAGREFEECCTKALVLIEPLEPFDLLTTIRWEPDSGYVLLSRHIERLKGSARYFGFTFDDKELQEQLAKVAETLPPSPHRIRILLAPTGTLTINHQPLTLPHSPFSLALASGPVSSQDRWLFHKTTRRARYEAFRAEHRDRDDVILWNERGEITESTIANVAVRIDGRWITPAVACGLLPGVQRAELLARGEIHEGVISVEDLKKAKEIALFNALRGWMPAVMK